MNFIIIFVAFLNFAGLFSAKPTGAPFCTKTTLIPKLKGNHSPQQSMGYELSIKKSSKSYTMNVKSPQSIGFKGILLYVASDNDDTSHIGTFKSLTGFQACKDDNKYGMSTITHSDGEIKGLDTSFKWTPADDDDLDSVTVHAVLAAQGIGETPTYQLLKYSLDGDDLMASDTSNTAAPAAVAPASVPKRSAATSPIDKSSVTIAKPPTAAKAQSAEETENQNTSSEEAPAAAPAAAVVQKSASSPQPQAVAPASAKTPQKPAAQSNAKGSSPDPNAIFEQAMKAAEVVAELVKPVAASASTTLTPAQAPVTPQPPVTAPVTAQAPVTSPAQVPVAAKAADAVADPALPETPPTPQSPATSKAPAEATAQNEIPAKSTIPDKPTGPVVEIPAAFANPPAKANQLTTPAAEAVVPVPQQVQQTTPVNRAPQGDAVPITNAAAPQQPAVQSQPNTSPSIQEKEYPIPPPSTPVVSSTENTAPAKQQQLVAPPSNPAVQSQSNTAPATQQEAVAPPSTPVVSSTENTAPATQQQVVTIPQPSTPVITKQVVPNSVPPAGVQTFMANSPMPAYQPIVQPAPYSGGIVSSAISRIANLVRSFLPF